MSTIIMFDRTNSGCWLPQARSKMTSGAPQNRLLTQHGSKAPSQEHRRPVSIAESGSSLSTEFTPRAEARGTTDAAEAPLQIRQLSPCGTRYQLSVHGAPYEEEPSFMPYPAAARSNSFGRLNISPRTSHSSGYIGFSKSWLAACRRYLNPLEPPVPGLLPMTRDTVARCAKRHFRNASSKSISFSPS